MRKSFIIFIFLCLINACMNTTTVRISNDFLSELQSVKSIQVIPADILFYQVNFIGKKIDNNKADKIKKQMFTGTQQHLAEKGYSVMDFFLPLKENLKVRSIKELLSSINSRLEETWNSHYKVDFFKRHSYSSNSINESIPEFIELSRFVKQKSPDAFLAYHFKGWEASKGKTAEMFIADLLDSLAAGSAVHRPTSVIEMKLYLVSGKTGKLLWMNSLTLGDSSIPVFMNLVFKTIPHSGNQVKADNIDMN